MNRRGFLAASSAAMPAAASAPAPQPGGTLRAGAATANITPALGANIAGGFRNAVAAEIHDELQVKSLVLDNGKARIAIAACDVCVMPGEVAAKAKDIIEREAGVPRSHVLVTATHTHSAPSTMHIFQNPPDPKYLEWLTVRIADSVRMAARRLGPARVGFAFGREDRLIFNRRYYMKPGTVIQDPFGNADRVKTNPGIMNPAVVKPAGPVDPDVGVLAAASAQGRPIAVVANYSLHYVGGVGPGHVSADYFAYWAGAVSRLAGIPQAVGEPPFVAILLNGAQGDINNVDVFKPRENLPPYAQMRNVAEILAAETFRTWRTIRFQDAAELGACAGDLELALRLPGAEVAAQAQKTLAGLPPGDLKELSHIYARETVILAREYPPRIQAPMQALRIGGLGIAAFPGEPFVELGLEVKKRSPFERTFTAGLANAHHGYIPTLRAFGEGGYETWRAKTSYLEKEAAPKMVAALERGLRMLAG